MKTLRKPRAKFFTKPRGDKTYHYVLAWLFDAFTLPVQSSNIKASIGFKLTPQKASRAVPQHLIFNSYTIDHGVLEDPANPGNPPPPGVPFNWITSKVNTDYRSSPKRSNVGEQFNMAKHMVRLFSSNRDQTVSSVVRRWAYNIFNVNFGYTEPMLLSIPKAKFDRPVDTKTVPLKSTLSSSYYTPRVAIEGIPTRTLSVVQDITNPEFKQSSWLLNMDKWYEIAKKK